MSLYVNFQLLALSELFWTHGALVVLDIEMDLLVRFQNVLIKKALATAFEWTFELPLSCVLHKVALQIVFVAAPATKNIFEGRKNKFCFTSFHKSDKQLLPRRILTAFCDSTEMTCYRTFDHTYHMEHFLCLCEFACEVKGFFYS